MHVCMQATCCRESPAQPPPNQPFVDTNSPEWRGQIFCQRAADGRGSASGGGPAATDRAAPGGQANGGGVRSNERWSHVVGWVSCWEQGWEGCLPVPLPMAPIPVRPRAGYIARRAWCAPCSPTATPLCVPPKPVRIAAIGAVSAGRHPLLYMFFTRFLFLSISHGSGSRMCLGGGARGGGCPTEETSPPFSVRQPSSVLRVEGAQSRAAHPRAPQCLVGVCPFHQLSTLPHPQRAPPAHRTRDLRNGVAVDDINLVVVLYPLLLLDPPLHPRQRAPLAVAKTEPW